MDLRLFAFSFAILFSWMVSAIADSDITIYSASLPPYQVDNGDGTFSGLIDTPVAAALTAAGIHFIWRRSTFNRELEAVEKNESKVCAVGFFKSPDRDRLLKYSVPVIEQHIMN